MKYEYQHTVPFEAYITNLGKYIEGELVGEWVKFPTSPEILQQVFLRIGIGEKDCFGNVYEEIFISDYDIYVPELKASVLGEYVNLDVLNTFAKRIEALKEEDYYKFIAILQSESGINSIEDYMHVLDHLDSYCFYPFLKNPYDLGYYYVEEVGALGNCHTCKYSEYINYEEYGEEILLQEDGYFSDYGYLVHDNF